MNEWAELLMRWMFKQQIESRKIKIMKMREWLDVVCKIDFMIALSKMFLPISPYYRFKFPRDQIYWLMKQRKCLSRKCLKTLQDLQGTRDSLVSDMRSRNRRFYGLDNLHLVVHWSLAWGTAHMQLKITATECQLITELPYKGSLILSIQRSPCLDPSALNLTVG